MEDKYNLAPRFGMGLMPKVGIVLVNYKDYAKRFLAECRDGLRQVDYPKDRCVVYIVDNETSDEAQDYLIKTFPEALVIPNEKNTGWVGGNNLGVQRALRDGCDDVVLLNMDVALDKKWLTNLVEAAYSDFAPSPQPSPARGEGEISNSTPLVGGVRGGGHSIGIVQSKILLYPKEGDGVERINSLGNEIHFLGFGFCRGYGGKEQNLQLTAYNLQLTDIPYASGVATYVKGEVFKQIGLFNDEFFMYHDDLEFCLRARLNGWRVVLAPESVIWHKYQFSRSIKQVYFMERNRLLALLYFYKWPTLALIAPAFLVFELGILLYSIKNKWFKTKLHSYLYFFQPGKLRQALNYRHSIQKTRQISDRKMTENFIGQVLFQETANPLLDHFANPLMNVYWRVGRRLIWW